LTAADRSSLSKTTKQGKVMSSYSLCLLFEQLDGVKCMYEEKLNKNKVVEK
jgi:hypothetical protein